MCKHDISIDGKVGGGGPCTYVTFNILNLKERLDVSGLEGGGWRIVLTMQKIVNEF